MDSDMTEYLENQLTGIEENMKSMRSDCNDLIALSESAQAAGHNCSGAIAIATKQAELIDMALAEVPNIRDGALWHRLNDLFGGAVTAHCVIEEQLEYARAGYPPAVDDSMV